MITERIFEIVERKKHSFSGKRDSEGNRKNWSSQQTGARICARMNIQEEWKRCGSVADFTSFFLPCGKKSDDGRRRGADLEKIPGIDNEWIYKQFYAPFTSRTVERRFGKDKTQCLGVRYSGTIL